VRRLNSAEIVVPAVVTVLPPESRTVTCGLVVNATPEVAGDSDAVVSASCVAGPVVTR